MSLFNFFNLRLLVEDSVDLGTSPSVRHLHLDYPLVLFVVKFFFITVVVTTTGARAAVTAAAATATTTVHAAVIAFVTFTLVKLICHNSGNKQILKIKKKVILRTVHIYVYHCNVRRTF